MIPRHMESENIRNQLSYVLARFGILKKYSKTERGGRKHECKNNCISIANKQNNNSNTGIRNKSLSQGKNH